MPVRLTHLRHAPANDPSGAHDGACMGAGTGTLGKAMAVLDLVVSAGEPMRFTDILSQTAQPRGTLHRQLSHLVEEGLLELGRDFRYAPGIRLLTLASRAWAGNELRQVAAPFLKGLHALTGETVHLGVLRGGRVIYLDKIEGLHSMRMHSQIGKASPVYCTGIGKAALAAMSDEAIVSMMETIDMHAYTAKTHTGLASLLADAAQIRLRGYALDEEEHELGIRCIAASFAARDGDLIGGLSVTTPAYRVPIETLTEWAGAVREAAGGIMAGIDVRLGPRREGAL